MVKRKTHNRRQSRPQAYSVSRTPWIITGFLCALIIGGLAYLYQKGLFNDRQYLQKFAQHENKKSRQPQFDFYNILPEMKLAEREKAPTLNPTPPPKPVVPEQKNKQRFTYLVQVASFPQFKDADHLKAELILTGFNVQIKPFEKDKKTWYRVMLGPYNNQADAKNTQQKLQLQKIKSFLITINDQGKTVNG